jgi:hypothetical protein
MEKSGFAYRRRLARVDVADDDQVDVSLLLLAVGDVSISKADDGSTRGIDGSRSRSLVSRMTYPILTVL